jgi:hypothetical protein
MYLNVIRIGLSLKSIHVDSFALERFDVESCRATATASEMRARCTMQC